MRAVRTLAGVASSVRLPDRPLVVDDLDDMPDDGRRYELSHGTLVVTPSPRPAHQVVVGSLIALLHAASPDGVLVGPGSDVVITRDTVKVPDVVVFEGSQLRQRRLTAPPLLVVEVHSPSTKVLDLTEKRVAYAAFGVPSYWLVDLDDRTVTVLELDGGSYAERAVARPGAPVALERPFPVTLDPEALFP